MNLEPDPAQQWLRTSVRSRLRGAVAVAPGPEQWALDTADESAEAAWSALRKLGAPAFDAPLPADGLELGLMASGTVAEELGRAALDGRYLAVAFAIDAATGGGDAPEALVRDLVAGDVAVTLAGFERAGDALRATVDDDGTVRLTGHLTLDEPDGAGTGMVLAPAGLPDGQVGLVLLSRSTLDVAPARHPSGARGLAVLAATRCAGSALLCRLDRSVPCPDGVLARARVRQAGYLLGLARGALGTAVRYATDRRQFDQSLREFQSMAFGLAAVYVRVEALRLAVARAAWLADSQARFGRQAVEVLAQAAETATETAQQVMQACGVRGMTGEVRAHHYYMRARREAVRLGQPGELWREAGRDRLRKNVR